MAETPPLSTNSRQPTAVIPGSSRWAWAGITALRRPRLVGSALEHDGTVIHMASFKVDGADKVPNMAGYRRRRAPVSSFQTTE
jgi:hypothetical protein